MHHFNVPWITIWCTRLQSAPSEENVWLGFFSHDLINLATSIMHAHLQGHSWYDIVAHTGDQGTSIDPMAFTNNLHLYLSLWNLGISEHHLCREFLPFFFTARKDDFDPFSNPDSFITWTYDYECCNNFPSPTNLLFWIFNTVYHKHKCIYAYIHFPS